MNTIWERQAKTVFVTGATAGMEYERARTYQTRAGIEATLSQAVRGMGIRRARYDGLHKTQVQHVATAVAINVVRIDAVLTQTPRGTTHQSTFMRLALHPALHPLKIA